MIREHIKTEQSYIDWLKSLGCIVYMPLTGDFEDKISCVSLTFTGKGSMVYDTNEDMTLATLSPSWTWGASPTNPNYYVAKLNTVIDSYFTDKFTYLWRAKRYTNSGTARGFGIITNTSYIQWGFTAMDNGTSGMGSWRASSFYFARVCDYSSNTQQDIHNGILTLTATLNVNSNPVNWNPINDGLIFGLGNDPGCPNSKCWMSEFYLFNTALDISTIRTIQGF